MNGEAWDGHDLLAAFRHSAATLGAEVDEVNALNVFPIPDGDTGTNMLATIQAALAEADTVPERDRSVPRVAAALSLGALMGARGNSGVILSQLFRGLGTAVADVEHIGGHEFAEALHQGCKAAFAAVSQPVEGTILTVARDASAAATQSLRSNGTLEHVLAAAATEASASVVRTQQLLPVLRRAGVVDAGGRGLELLLRGALASVRGAHVPHVGRLPHDVVLASFDGLEADGYGYETVFVVTPGQGEQLDVKALQTRLADMGDSVLVAGDERAAKVHIHNERPDEVLALGLSLGTLSLVSIENLDRQAAAVRSAAIAQRAADDAAPDAGVAPSGAAIIAVSPGEGWSRVFASLGATAIVDGGQGSNPSAGELAEAIRGTAAAEAIILANNPNVGLAARQAAELCPDVTVAVAGTRNAAEGVAAMLALESDLGPAEAGRLMAEAGRAIQTLQVTAAVRDARMGRRKVRRGQFIVLGPTDGLVAADDDRTRAIVYALHKLRQGFELLTLYRGRDVDHAAADELRAALTQEFDGVEIELVDGGQPHYDFLIAAE